MGGIGWGKLCGSCASFFVVQMSCFLYKALFMILIWVWKKPLFVGIIQARNSQAVGLGLGDISKGCKKCRAFLYPYSSTIHGGSSQVVSG